MNPIRNWKRLLAVACSHGGLADPTAIAAVVKFKRQFRPHKTIHLGDFTDTTAFRSGAKGSSDETEPVRPDIDAGLEFIEQLGADLVFCGNHEARIWRLAHHYNAIVSELSKHVIERIQSRCKRQRAELVEYDGVWQQRTIGNFKFMHGVFYSENAARDHAEAYGNCVHGHTHRSGIAKGRRDDNPTGFNVGTLTKIPNMDYANTRRATLAWSQGFVFGEYCDDLCQLYLHEQPRNLTEWRLPI